MLKATNKFFRNRKCRLYRIEIAVCRLVLAPSNLAQVEDINRERQTAKNDHHRATIDHTSRTTNIDHETKHENTLSQRETERQKQTAG